GLGESNVRIEIHVFGPLGERKPVRTGNIELIPENVLSEYDADDNLVVHVNGVRMKPDGSKEPVDNAPRTTFAVDLPSGRIEVPVGIDPDLQPHYGPVEALMIELANNHADAVFLDADALAEHLDLPGDVTHLFSFDDWE